MTLTERIVRDAKGDGKAKTIWDKQVMGLGLQVTPKGVKNFIIRYKAGDRKRQAIIARAGQISLSEARKRAGAELVRISAGESSGPLERREAERAAPTVEDSFDRFLGPFSDRRIANGRMTERTRREYAKQARAYVLPAVGSRKLADISRGDIERLVEPMPGPTRNRVLALISRVFTVAEAWEWRPQHSNPARGVERAVERTRKRVLSPEEMGKLAAALEEHARQYPAAIAAIRVAALTGLRIGEVLAFQWKHLDMDSGRIHLPETKTGDRDHDLPAPALAILSASPRINGNPWCFTSGRDAHVQYRQARKVFAIVAKAAGLDDVRLHDLRRTVATRAAAAGLSAFALKDMLGWKTAAMPERYVALAGETARVHRQAIGDQMAAMMSADAGKVVAFRRG